MQNVQNGLNGGSPNGSLNGTQGRIRQSIWRTVGTRQLFEYMLPEGSRIVAGMVFVPIGVGSDGRKKLECLGTQKEVCEKGLRGEYKK